MTDNKRLDEIESRVENATEGRWGVGSWQDRSFVDELEENE